MAISAQQLTIYLYSAHRAVIFAIAQLSCYYYYYNARAKDNAFSVGNQVVVLEKDSAHKTFARWKHGTVMKVRSPYSYDIQMPDGLADSYTQTNLDRL